MDSSLQGNTFVFMLIIGILIMLSLALAFVVFVNQSQKKLWKEQLRNQELAFNHQKELLFSTIMTQEAERKRIAQELHDEIGSKLNVILLNTHRFKKYWEENDEMQEIAGDIRSIILTTIDTTRRISHDLLPPTLDEFGLVEAIKELRDEFERTESISIQFEIIKNDININDRLIELQLYRALQELINNSIKHGDVKNIRIKFWLNTASVKLNYQDDGCGFDISQFDNKKGLGMKNIESRLNMIKANFKYNTSPGNGFSAEIILNLKSTKPQLNKKWNT